MPNGQSTSHLFQPKLLASISEGYAFDTARKDIVAGLTVAIVALPLSMAIAVASGVSPERGLYTSIVGGFLVSALGGSRFQIGGPAGAFIVLVASTVARYGLDGLLLVTLLSGAMMILLGASRLGSLIRYIPHAVTVGFTAGIAIIILASQIRDLGGLTLPGKEPASLLAKLGQLFSALPTVRPASLAIGLGVAAIIVLMRRWRPTWPGMLFALVIASAAVALLHLPVETIGSRFGAMPDSLPSPSIPTFSLDRLLQLLPVAVSFTLLGSVESLLSAKVADGMTGRYHRSNMELVAQGIANIGSALFGGISVTGTIARTATNVRAGARSPVAGILHSVFVLLFLLVAAPLAAFIPMPALAGVLAVVCWNMAEKAEFAHLLGHWRSAVVLLATFGLTLIEDLTTGILVGCAVAFVVSRIRKS
jgi:SulP family sulfate permease